MDLISSAEIEERLGAIRDLMYAYEGCLYVYGNCKPISSAAADRAAEYYGMVFAERLVVYLTDIQKEHPSDVRWKVESSHDAEPLLSRWYVIKVTPGGYWVDVVRQGPIAKGQHKQHKTPMKHQGRWHGKDSHNMFTDATPAAAWRTFLKRRKKALGFAEARVNGYKRDIISAMVTLGIKSDHPFKSPRKQPYDRNRDPF